MKFIALFLLLLAGSAQAVDRLVTSNLNTGAGTLREAAVAAVNGDRILFDPSLSGQTILLASPITLRRNMVIDGSGLSSAVTISGNKVSQIFSVSSSGVVTLDSLILRDGKSGFAPGGATSSSGQLTVRRCAFIQNQSDAQGGAIYHSSSAKLLVENSTFSGNASASNGGAIYFGSGSLELRSCTISGNTAGPLTGGGPGIGTASGIYASQSFTCRDSVIAGNSVNNLTANVYPTNTLTPTGAGAGNFIGGDSLLSPLGNYGGPTPAMIPLAKSPLIDPVANATTSPLAVDQRGSARVIGPRVDSGAVEFDLSLGYIFPSSGLAGVSTGSYPVSWSIEADADSFEIFLGTTSGTLVKVGTTAIGRFNLPLEEGGTTYYWRIDAIRGGTRTTGAVQSITTRPPFIVTTLADENDGNPDPALGTGTSLREAFLAANAVPGPDLVHFNSALSGGTITLGGTQLSATGSLRIDAGSLPERLTISADRLSRVLALAAEGIDTPEFVLTNLKLTGGNLSGSGAAISAGGKLVINRCEISGNEATGIPSVSGATVEMSDCSIESNLSTDNGHFLAATNLVLRNSTVAGNFGDDFFSAAVYVANSGTLENVTISDNACRGIEKSGSGALAIRHATVTRNRVSSVGGGLRVVSGQVQVENSIIAGNLSQSSDVDPNIYGAAAFSGVNLTTGDPLLAPLGNYGGSSKTAPPAIGSPAIDPVGAAVSSPLVTDQRGYPRVLNGRVDIGAVEFGPGPTVAPAPGATGVSGYGPVLYWTTPVNATSYSVYLGTSPGALALVGTTTPGQWNAGILEPGTTYYWRVDGSTGSGTVTGTVQSFTTRSALMVTTLVDEDNGTAEHATGSGTSLREALAVAAFTLEGDIVRFASTLAGGTLVLAGTSLTLPEGGILIDALPLPGGLTLSANRQSGVLQIPVLCDARLRGLTLRDAAVAAAVDNSGVLAMTRCTVTENRKTGVSSYRKSLTMDECLVLGNSSDSSDCGIDASGNVLLRRCTIAGNASTFGAAIGHGNGTLTLEQCTLTGNRSDYRAAISTNGGNVILRQCTIAGNSNGTVSVGSATLTVENSIVIGPDPSQSGFYTVGAVQIGKNLILGDPLLAPLGDYGGPVPTMPPIAGSPAIDPVGGSSSSSLLTDQRGLPRLVGARVDIGAVEFTADRAVFPAEGGSGVPNFRLPLCWEPVPGATSYQLFFGPAGSPLVAAATTTAATWTTGLVEPGTSYTWRVDATIAGGTVIPGIVRTFTTRPAFMVTTLADEDDTPFVVGSGLSLREAVAAAGQATGGDTIRFAAALDGATLRLGGSELLLDGVLAIDGSPFSHGIAISGNRTSSVFMIPAASDVLLAACTIRDGRNSGIRNYGSLSLSRCSVVHNRSGSNGGGIYNDGVLRVENSTIAANQAPDGGGIDNDDLIELRSSTVSANHGGGISGTFSENRLIGSIVAGNLHGEDIAGAIDYTEGANFVGGDPHLASLGDYGGPTPTMPPLAGSPVIDPAGSSSTSALLIDQRGKPRITGSLLDSGAVEWSPEAFWSPADGSSGLPVPRLTLNWNAQAGQQSHQVLLGTAPDQLVPVGSTAWGSFTLEGLAPATTYYWRIDSTSGGVSTSGSVRSFSTRPALLVTTAQDETDPSPASGTSLREALASAAGADGSDRIEFAPGLSGATINVLEAQTLLIDSEVTIDALPLATGPIIRRPGYNPVLELGGFATMELSGFTVSGVGGHSDGIKAGSCDLILDRMIISGSEKAGIRASGCDLRIRNSTVHGNLGGGINTSFSTLQMVNSTVSGNSSNSAGGGLSLSSTPSSFRHVTISGNTATQSGGLKGWTSNVTVEASIIAGNTAASNPDTEIWPGGITSSLVGVNPRLAPLGLYGGRVPIMPLLPGSPAIDLVPGASTNPPLDQRGATRPAGPAADAGAVEAFPFVSLSKIDTDSDGVDDRLEPALGFVVGQDNSGIDGDGDGHSDAVELDNMTDPADANDFLRITSLQGGAGERLIQFRSFPGMEYHLARSAGLSLFSPVPGSGMTATGRSSSMVLPDDPAPAFFRVERSTAAEP